MDLTSQTCFVGKYSGGPVNMWNKTGQTEQESMGHFIPHPSHPAHGSVHPPQPMQPQEKGSGTGMCFYKVDLVVTCLKIVPKIITGTLISIHYC